ncbi:exodeoxyribonuclease VII large subunit [Pseudoxanthomonas winnipegensis]|nr:exodeoxyribonuclease VII large subunit [Pseudoxanthomonas winnipegensis]
MNDLPDRDVLTPSQLNTLARDLLEGSFPAIWVEAELGNVTRPASGHLYFTLKDARAQVRCAMFKPKSSWLKFVPREGLRVLARGRVTLYEARGEYQLVLDHMEEAGEGALRRAFEQLKARLAAEGLFDPARKRPLPAFPRRLAVITSPSGAAVRDVISVLGRRFPLLEVDVLPTQVQGATAAAQVAALVQAAGASGRYDAVLVTRGGGSIEDLWAFNDEALVRAVAACAVPVVSAVGHETDFTLCDFAADLRAPTPSAAAELLVPSIADLGTRLRGLGRRLHTLHAHHMDRVQQRVDRAWLRLQAQGPQARLALMRRRHADALRHLQAQWQRQLERRRARLGHAEGVLARAFTAAAPGRAGRASGGPAGTAAGGHRPPAAARGSTPDRTGPLAGGHQPAGDRGPRLRADQPRGRHAGAQGHAGGGGRSAGGATGRRHAQRAGAAAEVSPATATLGAGPVIQPATWPVSKWWPPGAMRTSTPVPRSDGHSVASSSSSWP